MTFKRLLLLILAAIPFFACGKVTTIQLTAEMRNDFSIAGSTLKDKDSLQGTVLNFQGRPLVSKGDGQKKVLALLGEPSQRKEKTFIYQAPGFQLNIEMKAKKVEQVGLETVAPK